MTVLLRARLAALAIPLALVLAACGDDESPVVGGGTTPTTAAGGSTATTVGGSTATTAAPGTVVNIAVRGGSVDGPSRQRVALNQSLTIRVTSDVADEVHVHGYERKANVAPNTPAEITFVANIPGVFEVELEGSHRRLTTLEVQP